MAGCPELPDDPLAFRLLDSFLSLYPLSAMKGMAPFERDCSGVPVLLPRFS